jgi:predicted amidohydrolase YtcJ
MVGLGLLAGVGISAGVHAAEPADHLFIGEHIITMTDDDSKPSALAIRGERIIWVGDRSDSAAWRDADTAVHDLGSRALLPGFIDAHGHLTYLAATLKWANLASPPVGEVNSIASLQSSLRQFIAEREIPPGSWVIGNGYDDSLIAEQRHPDRDDLDAVSRDHPIALVHVSGHLMAANSVALDMVGIDSEMADPSGGHIRRRPGSREPNGVLEETATYPLRGAISQPSGNPIEDVQAALNVYAANGITTAQDGAISSQQAQLLATMDRDELLTLDVVIYPIVSGLNAVAASDYAFGSYGSRLKVGGIKLILDGSPQGKTAYLRDPYEVPPKGKDASYHGYPIHPPESVNAMVNYYLSADIPVIAHANGDAAATLLIDAVAAHLGEQTNQDHRTVMIHAQTVRSDQLDEMARLGIVPSYFSAHVFFWGDWHRDSVLGLERAKNISPTRSTIDRGIPFTIHNDTPIVPPDMLRLLWATTNRLTRSGQVLGAEQRLTTLEALRAITRDAAYQYFEENRKGTLSKGKLADLVILSADPTAIDPGELAALEIEETWSHGTRIYQR